MYAQRTVTKEWLHTDVPMTLAMTRSLNSTGDAEGMLPTEFQVDPGDGLPFWAERGTTLYAEHDRKLKWVGLCSFVNPTPRGVKVEFKGMTYLYDLVGFNGLIRQWEPDPFDMVGLLMESAHLQADGDVGIQLVRDGSTDRYPGDTRPPDRPKRVKRRRGETKKHFATRREERIKEQGRWEKQFGQRLPYEVAWWEAPYVGEEIAALATEIPFDWYEQHKWTNRDTLEARHEMVITPRKQRIRDDYALVEGQNIAEVLDPRTDFTAYGNQLVMLGAGEGSKMRRATVATRDGRVRTARFQEAKHVGNMERLRTTARKRFESATVSMRVDDATIRDPQAAIELGDVLPIRTSLFTGHGRVYGITENTENDSVVLTFEPTTRG